MENRLYSLVAAFSLLMCLSAKAQSPNAEQKADMQIMQKAKAWVVSLNLHDAVQQARVEKVIEMHLMSVRDWNNQHPYTSVPTGIDPATGNRLTYLDRQIIACSAIPASVHDSLMTGLRRNLNEQQVNAILDKYTVGKVAFTMKGYEAIVPDLTDTERSVIMANLKMAREQSVDYKSMKEISAIFEIYKTKNEQYLNTHGRNWHQLFKDYVNKVKAEKALKQKASH